MVINMFIVELHLLLADDLVIPDAVQLVPVELKAGGTLVKGTVMILAVPVTLAALVKVVGFLPLGHLARLRLRLGLCTEILSGLT